MRMSHKGGTGGGGGEEEGEGGKGEGEQKDSHIGMSECLCPKFQSQLKREQISTSVTVQQTFHCTTFLWSCVT